MMEAQKGWEWSQSKPRPGLNCIAALQIESEAMVDLVIVGSSKQ